MVKKTNNTIIVMDYAKGVKTLRGMKDFSKKQFASFCNISYENVVSIEEGLRKPDEGEVIKICKSFNIKECVFKFLCMDEKDMSRKQQIRYKKYNYASNLMVKAIFIDD